DDELLGTTYIDDQPRIQADSEAALQSQTRERAGMLNEPAPETGDRYLRSAREIIGYHIAATDGEIGHVEDLFIDEDSWNIQYFLVDTSNWLGGRHVLIAIDWIERVGWTDKMVHINLTREKIKDSPEYEPGPPLRRDYEMRLYDYYGFPGYWI
ncbi:MAG: PRC-barrel domain-containing protein, partial [Anaerolineae bacterium]|nr:PRC-barrel domain-containing protein [Anaerolineae bacterium]